LNTILNHNTFAHFMFHIILICLFLPWLYQKIIHILPCHHYDQLTLEHFCYALQCNITRQAPGLIFLSTHHTAMVTNKTISPYSGSNSETLSLLFICGLQNGCLHSLGTSWWQEFLRM
jgi:hypothetical protein